MQNYQDFREYLEDAVKSEKLQYKKNDPLCNHSSFKIGGPADFSVFPYNEAELCSLIKYTEQNNIPHRIFGNCSNVLFADDGYAGCVIFTGNIKECRIDNQILTVSCGMPLTSAAVFAQKNGLSGMEYLYGIPGSVGGAVYMNAGAYGGEIKDILQSVRCFDIKSGNIIDMEASELDFGYRKSSLQTNGMTALSASFRLRSGEPSDIKRLMEDYMNRRIEKQPLQYPSAGSVFKRAPGHFTGKLIEDAGLKGYRIGGAEVSEKHAGFIINTGGASAADVLALIEYIKDIVKEKFDVDIECELQYIPSGR